MGLLWNLPCNDSSSSETLIFSVKQWGASWFPDTIGDTIGDLSTQFSKSFVYSVSKWHNCLHLVSLSLFLRHLWSKDLETKILSPKVSGEKRDKGLRQGGYSFVILRQNIQRILKIVSPNCRSCRETRELLYVFVFCFATWCNVFKEWKVLFSALAALLDRIHLELAAILFFIANFCFSPSTASWFI